MATAHAGRDPHPHFVCLYPPSRQRWTGVQLQDDRTVEQLHLVVVAAVTAPLAEDVLVPAARRLEVGDHQHRLWFTDRDASAATTVAVDVRRDARVRVRSPPPL